MMPGHPQSPTGANWCIAAQLVWAGLALTALLSVGAPGSWLGQASTHGKVRRMAKRCKQGWNSLELPKSWFLHFYVLSFAANSVAIWALFSGRETCSTMHLNHGCQLGVLQEHLLVLILMQ
ncbi:unnamed protein product, partial [Chrysoparadoxa australica]